MLSLIEKKQAGEKLNSDEILRFVRGVTKGSIPDYQISAFLMAIYFQGLARSETVALTNALLESSERLTYPKEFKPVLDKHSTGGVGDKTSLILVPLLSAAGFKVPKMSGRGLGHTGGTIDKLESIPGLRVELTRDELFNQLEDVGCAIVSQSEKLVPAEKKLYALRDATATVNSLPLIVSSILSKKIVGGADAVVIDVKCGLGAFFKTFGDATAFASEAQLVSEQFPIQLSSVITDMNQPLGRFVGNALEVKEVIDILERGDVESSVAHLVIHLGAEVIKLAGVMPEEEAKARLVELIENHMAEKKFYEMVEAQGGDLNAFTRQIDKIADMVDILDVTSPNAGCITQLNAFTVGQVVRNLGGGRAIMDAEINPWVGVELQKKVGDFVNAGDVLARMYVPKELTEEHLTEAILLLQSAYVVL